MESGIKVMREEDKYIIMQENNQKKLEGVYANSKLYRERWKNWLGRLEEGMGRDGSILGDWNGLVHSWDKSKQDDARENMIQEWMTGTGLTIIKEDSRPTWERIRERRRIESNIDFVIFKGISNNKGTSTITLRDHV